MLGLDGKDVTVWGIVPFLNANKLVDKDGKIAQDLKSLMLPKSEKYQLTTAKLLEALKNRAQAVAVTVVSGTGTSAVTSAINVSLDALLTRASQADAKAQYEDRASQAKSSGDVLWTEASKNKPTDFVKASGINYYFQSAYMSGDQFAVGAALTRETTSRLMLFYTDDDKQTKSAKALVKFYGSACKLTKERLLPVKVTDSRQAYKDCSSLVDYRINGGTVPSFTDTSLDFLKSIPTTRTRLFAVGGATSQVAGCIGDATAIKDFIDKWNVDPSKNVYWAARIDDYLKAKDVQTKTSYAIMWTRFSGKGGGAHPELDDSYKGLVQVIHGLLGKSLNVIVVGMQRENKPVKDKLDKHWPDLDKTNGTVARTDKNLILFGEYWKSDTGQARSEITGPHRAAECALFIRMTQSAWDCKIVHLGMRSGAMDAAALLGMKTLFIEDSSNPQIARTQKWTGSGNTNPVYQRVPVAALPSQAAREKKAEGKTPTSADRGYSTEDVKLIVERVEAAIK